MIECIGHEYMPRTVHHNTKRVAQTGIEGRSLVPSVPCDTNPGNTLNTPYNSIPSPHQMVVRIRDVQIPFFIQRDSRWPRETGTGWLIRPLVPILHAVAHYSSYDTSDGINGTNPSVKT